MNKKEILTTLLGIIIGSIGMGSLIPIFVYNAEDFKINEENDNKLLLCVISLTVIGSIYGGFLGWRCSNLLCDNNEENLQVNSIYREFFDFQRIETNSIQLVNETTPLLQEHIVNINNEENLLNTNNRSNYSQSL